MLLRSNSRAQSGDIGCGQDHRDRRQERAENRHLGERTPVLKDGEGSSLYALEVGDQIKVSGATSRTSIWWVARS
jgi:hypothetical protein